MRRVLALAVIAALAACAREQPPEAPPPLELTREHIGYYCNMTVADHRGPKGQIHLSGAAEPLWFASVRDTLTFTLLPEESKSVAAIYVNDMGRADWDAPEAGTWVEARQAFYVVGSRRTGGMGAPEPVPFAEQAAALRFAAEHGGEVVPYGDIPSEYVLAAPDTLRTVAGDHQGHAGH